MNPDEQTKTWVELTNCLTRLGPDDLDRFLSCFTSDVYCDDSFLGVHEGHEGLTRLFDAIHREALITSGFFLIR